MRALLRLAAPVAVTALALIAPALANANDYCVGSSALCPVQTQTFDSSGLGQAVTAANAHAGPDRIFIAAGDIDLGSGFNMNPAAGLEIIGAGRGETRFTCTAGASSCINIGFGASSDSLSGFSVQAGSLTSGGYLLVVGVGTFSDFSAHETGGTANLRAVAMFNGGTIRNCSVSMVSTSARAVIMQGGDANIDNCDFTGTANSTGAGISGNAVFTISRSKFTGFQYGIYSDLGDITVSDTVFDVGAASNGYGIWAYNPNNGNQAMTLHVERSTIVGTGSNQRGILLGADSAGETFTGEVSDTVVYMTGSSSESIRTNHTSVAGASSLNISNSAFDVSLTNNIGDAPISPITSKTVDLWIVDPRFVDFAGGDYKLAENSPLVDAGTDGSSLAPGALDVAGLTRLTDGNGDGVAKLDIGANEYQPPVPVTPDPGAGSGGGGGAVTPPVAAAKITAKPKKAFKIGKSGFAPAKKGAASFTAKFIDAAKAKFTLQSIGRNKKLKSLKGSQKLAVKSGSNKIGFGGKWNKKQLAAGKYRVKITPLSSAGVAGKPVTVDIKLAK